MVLALTPIFLDERMSSERSPATLKLIEGLRQEGYFAGRRSGRGYLGVPHRVEAANLFQSHVLGGSGPYGRHR